MKAEGKKLGVRKFNEIRNYSTVRAAGCVTELKLTNTIRFSVIVYCTNTDTWARRADKCFHSRTYLHFILLFDIIRSTYTGTYTVSDVGIGDTRGTISLN